MRHLELVFNCENAEIGELKTLELCIFSLTSDYLIQVAMLPVAMQNTLK